MLILSFAGAPPARHPAVPCHRRAGDGRPPPGRGPAPRRPGGGGGGGAMLVAFLLLLALRLLGPALPPFGPGDITAAWAMTAGDGTPGRSGGPTD